MKRLVPTLILVPDEISRAGLLGILAEDRYRPVEVKGGWEAAASSAKLLPAIVVLIPNGPSIDAPLQAMIGLMANRSKVVVLADPCEADIVRDAMSAGAVACLPRSVSSYVLLQTLDLVLEGQAIFPALVVPAALRSPKLEPASNDADCSSPEQSAPKLSSREIDILKQLVHGDSNKKISRQLNISETTVKVHVKAILRKVRLSNRTQAALWGLEYLSERVSTPSVVSQPLDRVAEAPVPDAIPPAAQNAKLNGSRAPPSSL